MADEELVQKLVTALEGQSIKYEVYFKLVLAAGIRRGEVRGIRWSDIDWRRKTIHIQRTVASLLGQFQPSATLDIYSHAFDKNKRAAQEKLGKAIGL